MNYPTTLSEGKIKWVLDSFWIMLTELASQADNEDDRTLKVMVEGFARQWNSLTGSNYQPPWVVRAAKSV